MLVFFVLVAWAVTIVASVMPKDVTRNNYDHTTSNTTEMQSIYSGDNFDERTIQTSIEEILIKIHPDMFRGLNNEETKKKQALISSIAKGLKKRKPVRSSISSTWWSEWEQNVSKLLLQKEAVDKAILEMLILHYGSDYGFAKALVRSHASGKDQETADRLLKVQVNKWRATGQDVADVFKLLQLQKPSGENPFNDPVISQWFRFSLPKKNKVTNRQIMFDFLKELYKGDILTKLLVEANPFDPKMLIIIRSLVNCDVERWTSEKISDIQVFDLLQLNKKDSNPLESPFFPQWAKYVTKRYRFSKKAYEVMLEILTPSFKSKNDLVSALDGKYAKYGEQLVENRIETYAQNLLSYQYEKWTKEGKSAADVFDILNIKPTDNYSFSSSAFPAWVGFVKFRHSSDLVANETMLSILKLNYQDDLSKVLAEGAQIEKIKPVVEQLQQILENSSSKPAKRQSSNLDEGPPPKRPRNFDLNKPWSEQI